MNIKNTYNNYFKRQIQLIGKQKQLKLKNSKVLVIGAGGLGCNVLHQLANNGVGNLGIMDGDTISLSNLHRQKNYFIKDINAKKTSTLIKHITRNNPFVNINDYPFYLQENIEIKVFDQYDIIIDCTDNQDTKFLINDLCEYYKKPLIFGAIQKSEGQISVLNFNNGPTLRCAFPDNKQQLNISCEELGTMEIITSTVASKQVVECINLATENKTTLDGMLLHIDVLDHQTNIFKIKKSNSINKFDPSIISTNNKVISVQEFNAALKSKEFQFIDLRNTHEIPEIKHINLRNISINELKNKISYNDISKKLIIFCQSGRRSSNAIKILIELGCNDVVHLEGGINSLNKNNL